jgi:pimeloyl-ACP methyl ester carboxylesterase
VETLVLHGPEDHVIWPDFCERAERCFPHRVGPFVVPGAGHFLQWERADVVNRAVQAFLRDLAHP